MFINGSVLNFASYLDVYGTEVIKTHFFPRKMMH